MTYKGNRTGLILTLVLQYSIPGIALAVVVGPVYTGLTLLLIGLVIRAHTRRRTP